MKQESAHTSFWQTTDFMILVTLATGFLLDYFLPDLIILPTPFFLNLIIGGTITVIGIFIIVLAKKEFRKESQPSGPGKPTTKIINTGVYRRSRNPLYLGIIIAVAGIGLAIDNPWFLLLDIPLAVAIHVFLIIPEEKYLAHAFGNDYLSYMKEVRRWL